MRLIYLFIISVFLGTATYAAETLDQYRARLATLSDAQILELIKNRPKAVSDGTWSIPQKGTINREWYPMFGACKSVSAYTCSSCSCDWYMKSTHPNNYKKGYDGYGIYGSSLATNNHGKDSQGRSTGCLWSSQINDATIVMLMRWALADSNDPCGLADFMKTALYDKGESKTVKSMSVRDFSSIYFTNSRKRCGTGAWVETGDAKKVAITEFSRSVCDHIYSNYEKAKASGESAAALKFVSDDEFNAGISVLGQVQKDMRDAAAAEGANSLDSEVERGIYYADMFKALKSETEWVNYYTVDAAKKDAVLAELLPYKQSIEAALQFYKEESDYSAKTSEIADWDSVVATTYANEESLQNDFYKRHDLLMQHCKNLAAELGKDVTICPEKFQP